MNLAKAAWRTGRRWLKAVCGHGCDGPSMARPDHDVSRNAVVETIPTANLDPAFLTREDLLLVDYHTTLATALRKEEGISVVPAAELLAKEQCGTQRAAIRHDVDHNPGLALALARRLAREGIPSSFYLNHRAGYYGRYEGQTFNRSANLKSLVEHLLITGCEIGLRTSAENESTNDSSQTRETLQVELDWLKRVGVHVHGVVTAYQGTDLNRGDRAPGDRASTGSPLPAWRELGLSYCGDFLSSASEAPPPAPMRETSPPEHLTPTTGSQVGEEAGSWTTAYLERSHGSFFLMDHQFWWQGRDRWVWIDGRDPTKCAICILSLRELLNAIPRLPLTSKSLIVFHL